MFSKNLRSRLLFSKQIYNHGAEHADKPGDLNKLYSIISIDGAVENFLHTIITDLQGSLNNPNNPRFSDVFKAADEATYKKHSKSLPLKQEIFIIHRIRNSAQHDGVLPSAKDIERAVIYSLDFLNQSCLLCFNLSFDEIYLSDTISDSKLRNIMMKAEDDINKNNFENSIENLAIAFILLREKQKEVGGWRKKISSFYRFDINDISRGLFESSDRQIKYSGQRKFKNLLESMISEIEYINEIMEVVSLGANIQEYFLFKKLTPEILRTASEEKPFYIRYRDKIDYNKEICLRVFNFVYNLITTWESI